MALPAAAAAGGGGRETEQPRQQQKQNGFGQMITGIIRIAVFCFSVWHETNIPYATWGPESTRSLSMKYYPSQVLKNNGSLYAHVFFARSGYPPDPNDPEYQPQAAFGRTHSVVAYLRKSRADKKKSLLGNTKDGEGVESVAMVADDAETESKDDGPEEWTAYWKPNITINLVEDFTRYGHNAVPPNIAPFCVRAAVCLLELHMDNFEFLDFRFAELNIDPSTGNYNPTIFFNEFWLLRDKLIAINESVSELPLNLERVFLEGNPYLLAITMVVSLLHSVFDFLAFKNDIQFWNKNKSMEGLSAKSVVVSFLCQLIVFLYLLDNETSWMILASSGIGCCIEFWKIGKAMHIEIDRSGRIPMLRFRDRDSYASNKTKEYDDIAMKYLSYVLFFLVICFSIYSLMYERHKSWYSWILSSLTSCANDLQVPQHHYRRSLCICHKNANTPSAQSSVMRWIYPVDKKRVNEFGFGGEDDNDQTAAIASEVDKKTN
ncbi:Transmembrane CLPTM1 family protein isoform 2 [Hibiscus syriacus]|uniref:Transmembrane CLPTM1 family protein isoform 2 n=1 Tax=Hibiscus syriacus TaxID=106335 RepID=A0A6A3ATS8_HIBSY|nr:Transmembrane CLPTM1 family protein isoform 2 [Hibiscus syriacus]